MNEYYKKLLDPQGKFGIWGIVALIILGVSLMVVPGMFLNKHDSSSSKELSRSVTEIQPNTSSLISLEESLSKQATDILSQVEGVGKITVAVSLAAGYEQDYARNANQEKNVVKAPQIKGVLVVAEGAKDAETKIQLSRAVQSLFALPAHKIMILPMKGR